jgi:DNA-3-methyladenine glycosylase I
VSRCAWVPLADPLYVAYHDEEWGVPERDERRLFELLNLEGAQAGLSWSTILHKREGYRQAFAGWDIEAVARFDERDVERLVGDAGIVRHRGKIEAAIGNARAVLALDVPLPELLWSFVDGETRVNEWQTVAEIPAQTAESKAMSKELKRRGFRFTGPTTCYAFMQSATNGSRSSSVSTADAGSWSATQMASASARASAFASHAS